MDTVKEMWTPKIELVYKDGELVESTIQHTPNGQKEPYQMPYTTEEPSSPGEPDEVDQWKALLAEEHKQRMFLQWQLDKLIEQMLPINDDFIDDVLEDDDFEREKRLAFLQGVRWREAMYKLK